MTVGYFQGSSSTMPTTVTKTLPAGTYTLAVVQTRYGSTAMGVTLTIDGTATTYTIGDSKYGKTIKDTGTTWTNGYGLIKFTLSASKSVNLSLNSTSGNLYYLIATIYSGALY